MFEKLYRKAVINGHFLDDRVFDNILLKIVFEATQTNHMYLEQIYSIIYPNIVFVSYSDLPNNCAANLIIFQEKKHLHNLIRTYTFINF